MADMQEIEQLTRGYAEARRELSGIVNALVDELSRVKHPHLPKIQKAVGVVSERHAVLKAALDDSTALFKKPKTQTFDGVKVGLQKQKGTVEIDDEEKTIDRIEKTCPKDQVELLIRIKKSVHKPAVCDLVASDLKRLGISIAKDSDVVIIKPVDTEVDKLVNALLAEIEGGE